MNKIKSSQIFPNLFLGLFWSHFTLYWLSLTFYKLDKSDVVYYSLIREAAMVISSSPPSTCLNILFAPLDLLQKMVNPSCCYHFASFAFSRHLHSAKNLFTPSPKVASKLSSPNLNLPRKMVRPTTMCHKLARLPFQPPLDRWSEL